MPRVPAWAKEDIALSGRAYAGRIGLYERAESPMVSIAQVGTLGVPLLLKNKLFEPSET